MTAARVAIVADARHFVGPALARVLAGRGCDLVLGDPDDDLRAELEGAGATVAVPQRAAGPEGLVAAALDRFGRLDAAVAFSGEVVAGPFAESTEADLDRLYQGCVVDPYRFLRAVTAPMAEAGSGQVLVLTSAAGARPTPGVPLYSTMRAAANMLVRNVAAELAPAGVQVNAVGTNFMDFPVFLDASGARDPEVRARIEARIPLRRLGTMDELAHFCAVFLDGGSGFTTGQFVPYAGGWA